MITVETHVRDPDGAVRLTLRLTDPLFGDPVDVLADAGGAVTTDGADVLIAWQWPASMVPPDEVSLCARLVRDAYARWAAGWVDPLGLTITETGTEV